MGTECLGQCISKTIPCRCFPGSVCVGECIDGRCTHCATIPESLPQTCSSLALHSKDASPLPESCNSLSNSICFPCAMNVWKALEICEKQEANSTGILMCAHQILDESAPDCISCLCSMICYFFPHGITCKVCSELTIAKDLWIHHKECPQGSVKSEDGACFQAFNEPKSIIDAQTACLTINGEFAKVNTSSRIIAVGEAILKAQLSECWIGGVSPLKEIIGFEWIADSSPVSQPNFARGFPKLLPTSCMTEATKDFQWRNYDCFTPPLPERCFVCQVQLL